MTRDIDIALLRAFSAVVETGSVTRAARLLHRTQAAVSLQIKRLEELFSEELFVREHRSLTLTPAGERLVGHAQRMLAVNDGVWASMTTPSIEGEVRLGVPYDIVASHMPAVLKRFSQAWPRIQISLICKASVLLLEELEAGAVDLTLTTELEGAKSAEKLLTEPLVWVGGHGMQAHLERPLPIALGSKLCKFRPVMITALQNAGIDWRTASEGDHIEGLYATLRAGLAVAPMLRTSIPDFLEILGDASSLPPLPPFQINLYLPATGATDVAAELASHIRHEFAARFMARVPDQRRAPAAKPPMAAE